MIPTDHTQPDHCWAAVHRDNRSLTRGRDAASGEAVQTEHQQACGHAPTEGRRRPGGM